MKVQRNTSFGTAMLASILVLPSLACSAGGNNGDIGQGQSDAGTGAQDAAYPDTIIVPDSNSDPGSTGVGVPETCDQALANKSYIGCEYWPTMSPNSSLYERFEYAVVASNPTSSDAVVTVDQGGPPLQEVVVPPGGLHVIPLPWVPGLKQTSANGTEEATSALVPGAAYHVTSSVPIVLYQFSPLEFQLPNPPFDCPHLIETGGCYSFTNDASLQLPTTALRTEYYAMSYPTHHFGSGSTWIDTPGFITVTATADATQVTVQAAGHVRGGSGVQPMAPGDTADYTMNKGDVLLLASGKMPAGPSPQPNLPCTTEDTIDFCPTPQQYDLTGTKITSNKPVAVLGGHDCTFVPYNRYACDHLEESIFPVETLGTDLVVTAPQAVAAIDSAPGAPDNMFVRVMSAGENNTITFDPPVHPEVTLGPGQWINIGPLTQDFRVTATDRVMVAQYMVGENYTGQSVGAGDPSLSIAIPTEQYRLEYAFLAPATYTHNFVNVVAPLNATITIDGAPIDPASFAPIGNSGLGVARHQIPGGPHTMSGNQNFGIVVYGYGSYTSYMYPGGLNLETIDILK